MKKALVIGALILGLGVVGTARDYVTVGVKSLVSMVKKATPIPVDIGRLELAVDQLDGEIARNGRIVVEESVALDRFVKQMEDKTRSVAQLKSDLSVLRDKYVSATCDTSKGDLESAMSKRLARVKAQSESLASMKVAAENRRAGYEKMVAGFEKQKLDRDVLREKLDALRAEYDTMKMRGELEQSTFANSANRKASDLAIEIGDRLEVQRRLALQRSSDSDVELTLEDADAGFDLAELDSVLGTKTRLASAE